MTRVSDERRGKRSHLIFHKSGAVELDLNHPRTIAVIKRACERIAALRARISEVSE